MFTEGRNLKKEGSRKTAIFCSRTNPEGASRNPKREECLEHLDCRRGKP
jgi:hypothetical protein